MKTRPQAARFYASIFPNSRVHSVTPMWSESPSGPPGSVKVVDFTLVGQRFQAMTADRNRALSKRVTDAMMTMVKFDIAAPKKAWRG